MWVCVYDARKVGGIKLTSVAVVEAATATQKTINILLTQKNVTTMKKKIYVCLFSADSYNFEYLAKMSYEEKYNLASMHRMMEDSCADVVSLEEFQDLWNGDSVDSYNTFIFFVEH